MSAPISYAVDGVREGSPDVLSAPSSSDVGPMTPPVSSGGERGRTQWPSLNSPDYVPVEAPGEAAAYRSMISGSGGPNLFLRSVRDGEAEFVMKFIQYGVDARGAVDGYKNSALHYASFRGHHTIMALLLRAGCDPNAANHVGNTPLHLAVENCQEESVNILLMSGSDMQATNMIGQTALALAVVMKRDSIEKLLRSAGSK
jgi:hypothetical protein